MDKTKEPRAWSWRPSFTPRQTLTAEQLNAGLHDELARQRLINRAVHGYGVVVGLGAVVDDDGVLELDRGCLQLTGGLAFDRHGRMLYWGGGRIAMKDLAGPHPDHEGKYTLCAHFASRPPLSDDCHPYGGEGSPWHKEGVVFTLRPDCHDADRRCPKHPDGSCVGHDEYLCRRTGGLPGNRPGTVPESPDVDWILRIPGPLRPIDCEDWQYDPDPDVCVPIACLRLCDLANREGGEHQHGEDDEAGPDVVDCEPRYGFCPSPPGSCGVRPLVYRNPLLYELANDCEVKLSRVRSISWQDWIERGWSTPVPWHEFRQRITSPAPGFEIMFSRPIEAATIHDASIFIVALHQEDSADYWTSQQVPLRELTLLGRRGTLASGVRLVPTRDWLRAEVTGKRSNLYDGARFEITVRGQLLRDECGQMLDSRPVTIRGRTRQARPGGDFVSAFQVEPNPERHQRGNDDDNDGVGN
jgi:hypothetical protein